MKGDREQASRGEPGEERPAVDAVFAGVFRQHHDFVWRCLRRLGVPEAHVDDALQEVFVVVARRLAEFDDTRGSLRAWLFAIARHAALHARREIGRHLRAVDAAVEVAPRPDGGDGRRADADLLHRLLDTLDDDKRAAYLMCELEGMSGREASEILRVPAATVHSRLRLARQELKRELARFEARRRRWA